MTQDVGRFGAATLQRHRAGFVSRATAGVIDVVSITLLGMAGLLFIGLLRYLIAGPARCLARAALYLVFPAGLLWALVSRRNASLQDLVLRTAVINDWTYSSNVERGSESVPAARLR